MYENKSLSIRLSEDDLAIWELKNIGHQTIVDKSLQFINNDYITTYNLYNPSKNLK